MAGVVPHARLAVLSSILSVSACAPTSGSFEHRYPDGRPQLRCPTRNGVFHGEAVTWYPDGSVASRGRYRDGQKVGLFRFYDRRGALIRRELYVSDRRIWWSEDAGVEIPPNIAGHVDPEAMERAEVAAQVIGPPPVFVVTDPEQGRTGADARGDLVIADESARRLSGGGEWVRGRLGAYGRFTTADSGGGDDHMLGKTVLEGGGTLVQRLGRRHRVLLRGGLFLPVANDDVDAVLAERAAATASVRDTALTLPKMAGARASGALIGSIHLGGNGSLFGRFDLGVDLAQSIAGEGDYPRLVHDQVVVARSAAATGWQGWGVLVTAEVIAAVATPDTVDPALASALSLQLPLGAWQPYASIAVPFKEAGGDAAAVVSVGLAAMVVPHAP